MSLSIPAIQISLKMFYYKTQNKFYFPLTNRLKALLFLALSFISFICPRFANCATTTSPTTIALRSKAITKIKTHATAFLSDQQLSDCLDTLSMDFYQGKDAATMQNDVMNVVVGSLTGTQLMQGLNIYNTLTKDLGGSDATTAIIGKLTTVMMNNLSPFMNQLRTRVGVLKSRGKGQNACMNQQYRMTLQFFTFNRMKTILTRVKNNLDSNTWTIAKRDIGSLINWGMYGL